MPEITVGDRIERYGAVRSLNDPPRELIPFFEPPAFTLRANCRASTEPDKFTSKTPSPPTECASCPVKRECRTHGEETGSLGWWGGDWRNATSISSADQWMEKREQSIKHESAPECVA